MAEIALNWAEIDTVLLDMDGTLLDLHFDNHFWLHYLPKRYSEIHGVDAEEAEADLHQRFAAKRGSIEWYCLDYWSQQLELDIVDLKHQIKEKIAIRPFVEAFLQALQAQKKQVVLLTNAHRDSLDLKMQVTGLSLLFDNIISTHDYGMPKESAQLWHSLQKDCPFDPQRTLLVDDTQSVLESAEGYGIKHLLTLLQPDSQQAQRTDLHYPAFLHFNEIMPNA